MATMLITAALVAALQPPSQTRAPTPPPPLVAFPHPLISEVLYAVPTGADGDANGDGTRGVNGDEFVELINPHDRPIQLGGYTLSGKGPKTVESEGAPAAKPRAFKRLTFTFPPLELKPGEVVVVFNGYDQQWKGPVGDEHRAPDNPNELFAGARVLTMRVGSARLGFVNGADHVLLASPAGEMVQCISWGGMAAPEGEEGGKGGKGATLVEAAPSGSGSVTRMTPGGPLVLHPTVENRRFSPGKFPPAE